MAVIKKTPIERFVESFVRQNRRIPDKVGKLHIEKAEALIDGKLGYCCDNPEGTLDLKTPGENLLTRSIRMYLNTMTKEGNVQSLERTKTLLTIFREGLCNYCA